MEFARCEEDQALYDATVRFARAELRRDGQLAPGSRRWKRCAEQGLLGLCVPCDDGGSGLSALRTAHVMEALGYGCRDMGLTFSIAAQLFACAMPIAEHGREALRREVLPRLCAGAWIGANAITEAEAGSDVFALAATARADGDFYVLDGVKSYVTNGPLADVCVVYAKTDPAAGYLGLSAFAIRRGTPGLRFGEAFGKMGLESAPISSLYLEGCRVPAECRLGEAGHGAAVFKRSMLWERACLFAGYVGGMARQLEAAVEHARSRRQFGKKIAKFQAIGHKIADMKLRLEAARLLLYRACWRLDQGQDATLDVSMAKLAVSEAAVRSGLDLIQIYGGIGYTKELGVEQELRDAIPATIFSGTSEVQRDLIARELGL